MNNPSRTRPQSLAQLAMDDLAVHAAGDAESLFTVGRANVQPEVRTETLYRIDHRVDERRETRVVLIPEGCIRFPDGSAIVPSGGAWDATDPNLRTGGTEYLTEDNLPDGAEIDWDTGTDIVLELWPTWPRGLRLSARRPSPSTRYRRHHGTQHARGMAREEHLERGASFASGGLSQRGVRRWSLRSSRSFSGPNDDPSAENFRITPRNIDEHGEAWYGTPEASQMIGVSAHTIRYWIHNGKLRARRPGKYYRISLSEIRRVREATGQSPRGTKQHGG